MANKEQQVDLFHDLKKAEMVVNSMAGLFQNDFDDEPSRAVLNMVNDFNRDYDKLRTTMVNIKARAVTFFKEYSDHGYEKEDDPRYPPYLQRREPRKLEYFDPDDLPF